MLNLGTISVRRKVQYAIIIVTVFLLASGIIYNRVRLLTRAQGSSYTIVTGANMFSTRYNNQRKLARDSNGNLYAVYHRPVNAIFNIYLAKSTDGGETWTEEAVTSDISYNQDSPSIAIDSNNYIHITWHGRHDGSSTASQIRYIKYTTAWQQPIENLTSESYDQDSPSIAIDSNNYIHIVWHGRYSGSTWYYQIRYIKYTTAWQQPIENLTSESYDQTDPSIAIDSNNYIHIVWHGWYSGSTSYYQIRYIKYTTAWQQPIENLTSATAHQLFPNLIWANHPTVSSVKTNRSKDGYAFVWMDNTTVKFYKSNDLAWETPGGPETFTWDGGAGTGNWSEANNWDKDSGYPDDNQDIAVINTGSTAISTPIAAALTIGELQLGVNYSGNLTLGNNLDIDNANGQNGGLTISNTGAILYLNGKDLVVNGTFSNSGTLQINGDEAIVTLTNDNDSGTIEYIGTAGPYTIKNWIYYNLKINGAGGTFRLPAVATITVNGNLAVTAGAFDANGQNQNFAGNFFLSDNTTYIKGGTLTFYGTGAATYTDNNATKQNVGTVVLNKTNSTAANNLLTLATSAVMDNLTVDGTAGQEDTLTINSSQTLTITNGGTTNIQPGSMITGAGTLTLTDGAGANLSTTGTLSPLVKFDTAMDNVVIPARTYEGNVTVVNSTSTHYEAQLGTAPSQTIDFLGNLYLTTNSTGNLWTKGQTHNPTVNLTGDLTTTHSGSGVIKTGLGTGTWTVSGDINTARNPDKISTDGVNNPTGGKLIMNGLNKNINNAALWPQLLIYDMQFSNNTTITNNAQVTVYHSLVVDNGVTVTLSDLSGYHLGIGMGNGATTTIYGIVTGASNAGQIRFDNAANGLIDTTGTISSRIRFYMNGVTSKVSARTYDGPVSFLGVWTNTFQLGTNAGQTINFNSDVTIERSTGQVGTNTIDGSVYNPNVNIGGNFSITAPGSGSHDLKLGSGRWSVSGNVSFANTSLTAGSSILDMNKSSGTPQTLDSASRSLNNLTHSGAGTLQLSTNNLDINGNFENTAGTFDANGQNQNFAGNFSLSDNTTYIKGGTLTFDGTSIVADSNGIKQDLGAVVVNGISATLDSSIKVSTMTVTSGTLDFGLSNYTLELAGTGADSNVLTVSSGLIIPGTSTVKYTATNADGNINVATTTYNNLQFAPASPEFYDMTGSLTNSNEMAGSLTIDANATLNTYVGSVEYDIFCVDMTIKAGGTLYAGVNRSVGMSTFTVSGDFAKETLGTFTYGKSTVNLTGTGNLGTGGWPAFYNLNAAANSKTTTVQTNIGIYGVLTLGDATGTFTISGGTIYINLNGTGIPLVTGGATILGTGLVIGYYGDNTGNPITVAGTTYQQLQITGNFSIPFTAGGNITATSFYLAKGGAYIATFDTAGYDLTVNGNMTIGNATQGAYNTFQPTEDSVITVTGNVAIVQGAVAGRSKIDLSQPSFVGSFSVGGNWSNGDIFIAGNSSTVSFTKSAGGTPQTLNSGGQSFNNLTHSGTDTLQLAGSALDVNGNFENTTGTFDANNLDINVGGNWTNLATFTAGAGTVIFDEATTPVSISGSTTFNNLTMNTNGGAKQINFLPGELNKQVVSGTWALAGNSDKTLTLRSATPGLAWYFEIPMGFVSGDYIDVQDSHSTNVNNKITPGANVTDSGRNDGWLFAGSTPATPTIGIPQVISATTIRWTFIDNAGNETGFKVYDAGDNPLVTCAAPDLIYCDETDLLVNTQYAGRYVVAYNASGSSARSGTADSIYTLANTPLAPGVNDTSTTSLTVIINTNTNPAVTQFSILNETLSKYIQADGSSGDNAIWQDYAAWGGESGIENIGLEPATSYTYKVKAQNGNGEETAFSPSSTQTTLAGGSTPTPTPTATDTPTATPPPTTTPTPTPTPTPTTVTVSPEATPTPTPSATFEVDTTTPPWTPTFPPTPKTYPPPVSPGSTPPDLVQSPTTGIPTPEQYLSAKPTTVAANKSKYITWILVILGLVIAFEVIFILIKRKKV